ncbi:LOW QUALITY PROTEIN: LRR domain containing protein [Trema orientale]|uniref:LRR domain containing protein n=1 Tax=Trema orientale TaxID=63057 RepID=A0A2P5EP21_TREOI|nr:LOW QUALITY PROTEIN: LRR domain containing protein [Trema orientale]
MDVNTSVVQNFFSCSPMLDDFRLIECSGLTSLEIPNNLVKLKSLLIKTRTDEISKVAIRASNLESTYSGSLPSEIKLEASEDTLKKLAIERTNITGTWLQCQIARFVGLKVLILENIDTLTTTVKISSQTLTELIIMDYINLEAETIIDAPD